MTKIGGIDLENLLKKCIRNDRDRYSVLGFAKRVSGDGAGSMFILNNPNLLSIKTTDYLDDRKFFEQDTKSRKQILATAKERYLFIQEFELIYEVIIKKILGVAL